MYDFLLFDLDGTITNSGPGITNAARYALEQQQIDIPDPSVLFRFIGPPLTDSFARYFNLTGERNTKAVSDFRVYYKERGRYESTLYDGIFDVIRQASESGKTLILCSSKLESTAIDILHHFGLDPYFTLFAGGIDGVRSEKTEVIAYCLELIRNHIGYDPDPSRIVMIGDREFDILGALDHGLDSIGVLFGFGSREELSTAGATHLAATAQDILTYI